LHPGSRLGYEIGTIFGSAFGVPLAVISAWVSGLRDEPIIWFEAERTFSLSGGAASRR
jgi:hypothetical protein